MHYFTLLYLTLLISILLYGVFLKRHLHCASGNSLLPVLRVCRIINNHSYCPLTLWEIQTAQEPIRTREVSLPHNN